MGWKRETILQPLLGYCTSGDYDVIQTAKAGNQLGQNLRPDTPLFGHFLQYWPTNGIFFILYVYGHL